ncbi:MAG: hypothetical protein FJ387_11055 [Verrucomicrobia bacterium]|nr:hypothetical protein [Verrucomicrobiota bacterium]
MRPRAASLALVLIASLLAGCAGYRLGPTAGFPAGSRTVRVGAFLNNTREPRLADAVVHALRKRFQQDGTFRLATHDPGDVLLTGTILRYDRTPVSFQPSDIITARDYEIYLTVHVVAEESGTGRKLVDREVRGRTVLRSGADLASAERQALPVLAEDWAYHAAAHLVDGAW